MNVATIVQTARLLNLNCRDAAYLDSESFDRELGRAERLGLKIHRALCRSCARFRRQLDLLEATFHRLRSSEPRTVAGSMPVEVRERIARALAGEAD